MIPFIHIALLCSPSRDLDCRLMFHGKFAHVVDVETLATLDCGLFTNHLAFMMSQNQLHLSHLLAPSRKSINGSKIRNSPDQFFSTYVWVHNRSNMPMFCLKKIISQLWVVQEAPSLAQMTFTQCTSMSEFKFDSVAPPGGQIQQYVSFSALFESPTKDMA